MYSITEVSYLKYLLQFTMCQQENVDTEKSSLQAKLERAENRASTLEQQMVKNAREWAKEKQELTIRLQEHRNGIIRKNAS